MRQVIGSIWLVVMVWASAWAQPPAFEARLAEKLGLCTSQRTAAASFSAPCHQCQIEFISLSPGGQADQLFFIEARSAENCGSGGCTGSIYRKNGQHYEEILNFFGFFERAVPRSGNLPPDIIYTHLESPRHDFDKDGAKDNATITARYRWSAQKQTFEIIDIISIETYGQKIAIQPWRQQLLREYQQQSPWVF